MFEMPKFKKFRTDKDDWLERLSKWIAELQSNQYFEQLLIGKFVSKHEKGTVNTDTTVTGDLTVSGDVSVGDDLAVTDNVTVTDGTISVTCTDTDAQAIQTVHTSTRLYGPQITTAVPSNLGMRNTDTTNTNYSMITNSGVYGVLASAMFVNVTHGASLNLSRGGMAFHIRNLTVLDERLGLWPGSVVVNESGSDVDFKVEGASDQNNIYSDASTNRVGIGTDSPTAKLDVRGDVVINEASGDYDVRIESNGDANNFFSDGGTDRVGIGTNAPETKLDVRGVSRFGDGTTNYTEFEADGTMEFNGTATVWEDLRVEPIARTTGANAPTFTKVFDDAGGTSRGVYLYAFDDAAGGSEKEIHFTIQMPHAAKTGSAISPHVHWVGAAADTTAEPRWGLEYCWAEIGADYGDTTIVYSTGAKIGLNGATDADVTAGRHYISEFADLTPSATQNGISSILIGRLFRDSADAGDTYNAVGATCYLLYIDFHYEVDTCGSRSEYAK